MSGQAAVLSDRRPAVLFNFNFVTPGIDHGLDRQNHPFLEPNSTVGLAVIGHRGLFVQLLADAMTHKGTDDRVARAFRGLLDRKAEIPSRFPSWSCSMPR